MARLVLAFIAVALLCRLAVVDAACCTSGQPTYAGSGLKYQGVPTCSDGPCKGRGFDYTKVGGSESEEADSCCDTEELGGFSYNPQAGSEGKWPGIPGFPISEAGTGKTCDAELPRYRCSIGGVPVRSSRGGKRFSMRHLL